ncbi:hypothetical protein B0T18DRAFT_18844 [Schizothecium vesticola]|uniref:Uncharacterized protein n=1 Tax=Schizothecium vesticola TaxID=314040 RepID=A0AA40KBY2_9PEZI|nr:hypothetical protein B0T18DRAFT_18844 [Schizothecium vesticola]
MTSAPWRTTEQGSLPRAKKIEAPHGIWAIEQASLGQRPRRPGAGHQVMAVFCFNLVKREAGAGAGAKRQAHPLPERCRTRNLQINLLQVKIYQTALRAAKRGTHTMLPLRHNSRRTLAEPQAFQGAYTTCFSRHIPIADGLTLGPSLKCHLLLTGALAVPKFSRLVPNTYVTSSRAIPEARDRAHLLRSLSQVCEASRARLPFSVHGNPPYFQHITHFYNQSHTCCAHTPSLTEHHGGGLG